MCWGGGFSCHKAGMKEQPPQRQSAPSCLPFLSSAISFPRSWDRVNVFGRQLRTSNCLRRATNSRATFFASPRCSALDSGSGRVRMSKRANLFSVTVGLGFKNPRECCTLEVSKKQRLALGRSRGSAKRAPDRKNNPVVAANYEENH